MNILIDKGADINSKDNSGATPLYVAVNTRRSDVVEYLIAKKADIEARDNDGLTALALAVRISNLPAVKILLENGADRNTKNNTGETLLDIAEKTKLRIVSKTEVKDYMLQNNNNLHATPYGQTPKPIIWLRDLAEIEKLLVAKGAQ